MNEIEKKVLERVTPSSDYRKKLQTIILEIREKLEKEIKNRSLPVKIELVGSTAKNTYLKDDLDIDFFLMFPTKFAKEDIAKNALSIGRKLLIKTEESYAEHPYLRGYYQDFFIEIVPCYKIEKASQKLSAVDRTPLHTKYIKENIFDSQKSEVLLFKQFLKGIGCYGAEAEVEGFSGYLCEILILKYGTFRKLIENAKNWKKGEKLALSKGKYQNYETPLTFIDPVDIERNVASAISQEKFDLFVKACKKYLKKPSITFFFPNKIKPWPIEKIKQEIQKQKSMYIGVKLDKPDIIDENLYPQVRKAARSIWEVCERNDFTIYDAVFHIKEKTIYILVKYKDEILSKTLEHMGPPTKLKENSADFLKRWKNDPRVTKEPYEKGGRFFVEIKRDYTDIKQFLKDQIKNMSMGKHLDKIVNKKYSVLVKEDLLKDDISEFWTEYLDGKMSWER
ncbi:MAG: CCA tRNA nucleotidyltransferase [Thermoplasmatales archaeon]|nr:CCA tRNA nucleotidyltransferase [Thermoplasmatales archaeon]